MVFGSESIGHLSPNDKWLSDIAVWKDSTTFTVHPYSFTYRLGLMAGANMSGELARPSVSIPRGTVQAVLTTLFVYIMTAFLMASTSSRYLLQNDYTVSDCLQGLRRLGLVWSMGADGSSFQVMMDTNFQRWFILIGIFSTTLFSSMSNLIGVFIRT